MLPQGWVEYTDQTGRKYYYNASTKETTWTKPAAPPAPVKHPDVLPLNWTQYTNNTGRKYYYNSVTLETSWTYPSATAATPTTTAPAEPEKPKKKKRSRKEIAAARKAAMARAQPRKTRAQVVAERKAKEAAERAAAEAAANPTPEEPEEPAIKTAFDGRWSSSPDEPPAWINTARGFVMFQNSQKEPVKIEDSATGTKDTILMTFQGDILVGKIKEDKGWWIIEWEDGDVWTKVPMTHGERVLERNRRLDRWREEAPVVEQIQAPPEPAPLAVKTGSLRNPAANPNPALGVMGSILGPAARPPDRQAFYTPPVDRKGPLIGSMPATDMRLTAAGQREGAALFDRLAELQWDADEKNYRNEQGLWATSKMLQRIGEIEKEDRAKAAENYLESLVDQGQAQGMQVKDLHPQYLEAATFQGAKPGYKFLAWRTQPGFEGTGYYWDARQGFSQIKVPDDPEKIMSMREVQEMQAVEQQQQMKEQLEALEKRQGEAKLEEEIAFLQGKLDEMRHLIKETRSKLAAFVGFTLHESRVIKLKGKLEGLVTAEQALIFQLSCKTMAQENKFDKM